MMEKEVMIHIRGIQSPADGQSGEPVETAAPGKYYFRGGSHYLRYEEYLDDSGKSTVSYVKISPRGMEVRRRGQVETRLIFEQGKRSTARYATAFGTIPIGIFTRSLKLSQTPASISAEADYALETEQGQSIVDCHLTIRADSGCPCTPKEGKGKPLRRK